VNPDLDLALERIIRAPPATVWRAWTDPSRLERWWVPAPSRCRVERLDPRHGDPEARALHEKLGFAEGWGSVTGQLATLAESMATR
jgi:uncharacterized protein YndB with AHSA1/START domain